MNPGEVVALVGHSGGGKSTIVSLIERFYQPTRFVDSIEMAKVIKLLYLLSGRITLDGYDISTLDAGWYRSNIGFVGQEPVLFACSIRENISFGMSNVTQSQVEEAATMANAHQFINDFPDKYKTLCGERGVCSNDQESPDQQPRTCMIFIISCR
jgi:ABC-type multidrug transport system fused ATPase/permease subunit